MTPWDGPGSCTGWSDKNETLLLEFSSDAPEFIGVIVESILFLLLLLLSLNVCKGITVADVCSMTSRQIYRNKYGKNVSKIKIEHVNYVKYYYANTWNILFKHCLSVGSFLSVIILIFYCVCNRKAKRVDTISNLNGFVIIYQRTMSSIQWFFWITEMWFQ